MKKLIFLLALTFLLAGISTSTSAQQTQGDIFLEGGLGYGSKIQSLGIQAGGLYTINSQFRVGADTIYFLPGEDSNGNEFSWLEFNANAHYFFINQESMNAYVLGGLNFATLFSDHSDIVLPSGDSINQVYAGLNIGAGVQIPLDSIHGYLEGKYSLSSAHQLALTGGVRIPIVK